MTATGRQFRTGGPSPRPAAKRASRAPSSAGVLPGPSGDPADPWTRESGLVLPFATATAVTGAVPAGGGLPVAVSRVVLSIPEVPVPKKRPQLTWRRGAEHAYTPAATLLAEKRIRGHARGQLGERWPPLVGPVRLSVTAYLPMPRDIPKRLQATAFPVRRPDLDNCLKLIMDAL